MAGGPGPGEPVVPGAQHFLYEVPPWVMCRFYKVMDALEPADWCQFAALIVRDQTELRLCERSEQRTASVLWPWINRNARVADLVHILTHLQLLRARDIITAWHPPAPVVPPSTAAPRPSSISAGSEAGDWSPRKLQSSASTFLSPGKKNPGVGLDMPEEKATMTADMAVDCCWSLPLTAIFMKLFQAPRPILSQSSSRFHSLFPSGHHYHLQPLPPPSSQAQRAQCLASKEPIPPRFAGPSVRFPKAPATSLKNSGLERVVLDVCTEQS